MRILFLDCTGRAFDGRTAREQALGGIETCTVNLAEALADAGANVTVATRSGAQSHVNGVDWRPFEHIGTEQADVVIANNDARLFSHSQPALNSGALPLLWFHNPVGWARTLRKGRLGPILRHRPGAVFCGDVQAAHAPHLLPFRFRATLLHGIENVFLEPLETRAPPSPRALFVSAAHRGLNETLQIWRARVPPTLPTATLDVFASEENLRRQTIDPERYENCGVLFRPPLAKSMLAQELASARLLLCPGAEDETFCLAAAEAQACGLPVVTRGTGALKERVRHERNGLIAPSERGFGDAILRGLQDDDLWQRMSLGARDDVEGLTWSRAAERWIRLIETHRSDQSG